MGGFQGFGFSGLSPAEVIKVLGRDTGDPHGFLFYDDTECTLSFNSVLRTVTITPVDSTGFSYYISGRKFVVTEAKSVVFTNSEGIHFFYMDTNGALQSTTTFANARVNAYCAVLYWDASNNAIIYQANERHTTAYPVGVWVYLHTTLGTQYRSGAALSAITVDGTGNANSDASFTTAVGIIDDEDVRHSLPQQTAYDIFYKSGASGNWRIAASNSPYGVYAPVNRAQYNQFTGGSWQLTTVSNQQFLLAHVFATNNLLSPYIVIMGQATYLSSVDARNGANDEINNLITTGLPFEEFVPVATLIYQTADSYTNDVQSRIRSTDTGDDYVNWLGQRLSPTITPGSHNNLSFLQLAGFGITYGHVNESQHLSYLAEYIIVPLSDETTELATGTGVVSIRVPFAMTVTAYRASVVTAPAGSTIVVDVLKNGVSVLSTAISIDAGETTSVDASTQPVISDNTIADNDILSFDIDQVGASTPGAGLKIEIIGYR